MAAPKRSTALIAVTGLLAVLVVIDRAGLLGGPSAADPTDPADAGTAGAPALHAAAAARLAELRATVDDAPEWRTAEERLDNALARARGQAIEAINPQLASARLADLVTDVLQTEGLSPRSTNTIAPTPRAAPGGPGGDAPLESPFLVVALSMRFDAADPERLHRVIDRLENNPAAAVNVRSLSVRGPGPSLRDGLRVDLTVEALAFVPPGGSA